MGPPVPLTQPGLLLPCDSTQESLTHPSWPLATPVSAWPSQRIRELLPTSSRHFQTSWQRTPALWWPPSPSQAAHPLQLPHTHSSKQPEPRPRLTDRREENILWNLYVFIVDFASTWSPPRRLLPLQGLVPGAAPGAPLGARGPALLLCPPASKCQWPL